MTRVDLMRLYDDHYAPAEGVRNVLVPPRPYVATDISADYRTELRELRFLADLLSEAAATAGHSWAPMPLEGLWTRPDNQPFDPTATGCWRWTAMICLPPTLTALTAERVFRDSIPHLNSTVRLLHYGDGPAVQAVHTGPLELSGPAVASLHRAIEGARFSRVGPHHEIYLTDPLTTPPEAMRTILRQGIVEREQPEPEGPYRIPGPLLTLPEQAPRPTERVLSRTLRGGR